MLSPNPDLTRFTTARQVVPVRSLFWHIPREWEGQTAFIVGGGTSVLKLDLNRLRGRRVMVINSSYLAVPWADALIFADKDWWDNHKGRTELALFKGYLISVVAGLFDKRFHALRRCTPEHQGLAKPTDAACINFTTTTAAINACVHFGAKRIVLLGIDGGPDKDGRVHHHEKHPNEPRAGCWQRHNEDLKRLVKPLRDLGVECFNVNQDSLHRMFPYMNYEEALCGNTANN